MVKVPQEDLPGMLLCKGRTKSTVLGSLAQPSEEQQAQSTKAMVLHCSDPEGTRLSIQSTLIPNELLGCQ